MEKKSKNSGKKRARNSKSSSEGSSKTSSGKDSSFSSSSSQDSSDSSKNISKLNFKPIPSTSESKKSVVIDSKKESEDESASVESKSYSSDESKSNSEFVESEKSDGKYPKINYQHYYAVTDEEIDQDSGEEEEVHLFKLNQYQPIKAILDVFSSAVIGSSLKGGKSSIRSKEGESPFYIDINDEEDNLYFTIHLLKNEYTKSMRIKSLKIKLMKSIKTCLETVDFDEYKCWSLFSQDELIQNNVQRVENPTYSDTVKEEKKNTDSKNSKIQDKLEEDLKEAKNKTKKSKNKSKLNPKKNSVSEQIDKFVKVNKFKTKSITSFFTFRSLMVKFESYLRLHNKLKNIVKIKRIEENGIEWEVSYTKREKLAEYKEIINQKAEKLEKKVVSENAFPNLLQVPMLWTLQKHLFKEAILQENTTKRIWGLISNKNDYFDHSYTLWTLIDAEFTEYLNEIFDQYAEKVKLK